MELYLFLGQEVSADKKHVLEEKRAKVAEILQSLKEILKEPMKADGCIQKLMELSGFTREEAEVLFWEELYAAGAISWGSDFIVKFERNIPTPQIVQLSEPRYTINSPAYPQFG